MHWRVIYTLELDTVYIDTILQILKQIDRVDVDIIDPLDRCLRDRRRLLLLLVASVLVWA